MKLVMMIAGLGGVVGFLIIIGVLTGMLKISLLDDSQDAEHRIILSKMEEVGNLELIHYNFNNNLSSSSLPDSGAGGSSGEAAACINLKQVGSEDIKVERNKVVIYLPPPDLCYSKVGEEMPAISSAGMISGEGASADLRNEDDNKLKQKAVSLGIYEQAKKNAESIVRALLSSVTGKEIVLKFKG